MNAVCIAILFIHLKNVLRSDVLFINFCLQSSSAAHQNGGKNKLDDLQTTILLYCNDDNKFDINYKVITIKQVLYLNYLKDRRIVGNRLKCHDIAFLLLWKEPRVDYSRFYEYI